MKFYIFLSWQKSALISAPAVQWTRRFNEHLRAHAMAPPRRQPLPTERNMRRVSIHSLHHTTASCRPIPLIAQLQRLHRPHPPHERTRAQAFPYHIADRTSGSSSAHPPLQATPGRKTTRRAANHAPMRFVRAVRDVGQMGAGAAKPSFTTRPLSMLSTVGVTADSVLRWDSRSWCTVRSCLRPRQARTYYLYTVVA
jgi:hypothetical protein